MFFSAYCSKRHNNEAPTSSSCCHNFLLHWNVILVSILPLGVGIISSKEAMCADIISSSSAITTRSLVHKQLVVVPSPSLEIMVAARALGDQKSEISNNTSGYKVVSIAEVSLGVFVDIEPLNAPAEANSTPEDSNELVEDINTTIDYKSLARSDNVSARGYQEYGKLFFCCCLFCLLHPSSSGIVIQSSGFMHFYWLTALP